MKQPLKLFSGNQSLLQTVVVKTLREMAAKEASTPVIEKKFPVKEFEQLTPIVKAEVSSIFLENKFLLTSSQLEAISLNVAKEAMDSLNRDYLKDFEISKDVKPLTKEELARLVGERIATMTIGGKEQILVFGFGNMARAISEKLSAKVTAIIHDESKPRGDQEKVAYLSKSNPAYGQIFDEVHGDVMLSVKPQKLDEIASDLKKLKLKDGAMLISVLAGISTKILKSILPENAIAIRTMPNTPISVGYGATGVYLPPELEHKKEDILKYFGTGNNKVVFVEREDQINDITGLSGSGPAYFFLLAEKIAATSDFKISEKDVFDIIRKACAEVDIAAYKPQNQWQGNLQEAINIASKSQEGVKDLILSFAKAFYEKALALGFSAQDAKTLAVGTAVGAGEYGFASDKTATILRENVTSPNGTTFEALKVFNEFSADSLNKLVEIAIQAASDKSEFLGKEAEKKILKEVVLEASSTQVSSTQASPLLEAQSLLTK